MKNKISSLILGKGDTVIMLSSNKEDNSANCLSFIKSKENLGLNNVVFVSDEDKELNQYFYIEFLNKKSIEALIKQLKELKKVYK